MDIGHLASDEQVKAAAAALLRAGNSWASLRALRCKFLKIVLEDTSTASFHSAVSWVLGRAEQLEFLALEFDRLQFLPSLTQLR